MGVYYCEDAREIGRKLLIPQGLKIICKVKADTGEPDMGFFFFLHTCSSRIFQWLRQEELLSPVV